MNLIPLLKQAGFKGPSLQTMLAIIQAESGGNPRAYNPRGLDRSYGLAQINMYGDLGPARMKQFGLSSYEDLYNPLTNLKAAYQISKGGTDFNPWTTYTSGKYKEHLRDLPAPAKQTVSVPEGKPARRNLVSYVQQAARTSGVQIEQAASRKRRPGHLASYVQQAISRSANSGELDPYVLQAMGKTPRKIASVGPQKIPVESTSSKRDSNVNRVLKLANEYLGTPYVWGGANPGGFDCSGLVKYLYGKLGVDLPHYTISQAKMGKAIGRDQLEPGDAVFFRLGTHPTTGEYGPQHMGLYIGNGKFLHAPQTGDVVKISNMSERDDFVIGRRYI